MKTSLNSKEQRVGNYNSAADVEATSKVTLGVVAGLGGAVGLWGFACLASGLAQGGVGVMVVGYLQAIGLS